LPPYPNFETRFIRESWAEFEDQRPLDITFVDDDLASRYGEQETVGTLVTTFTLFALLIAALGLFGLASLAVQQKTKEIGIRKSLGANQGQLIMLVSKEFAFLLVIANVLAWPIAFFLLNEIWLDQFPYRAELTAIPFALAAVGSLLITIVATIYHSAEAARANPVLSLRNE
jgi:putative ABC transport system permease protein